MNNRGGPWAVACETSNLSSAPALRGLALPEDMLRLLYGGAAEATMQAWFDSHR